MKKKAGETRVMQGYIDLCEWSQTCKNLESSIKEARKEMTVIKNCAKYKRIDLAEIDYLLDELLFLKRDVKKTIRTLEEIWDKG